MGFLSQGGNPSKGFELGPSLGDSDVSPLVDYTVPDVPSAVGNSGKDKSKEGMNDNNLIQNSHLMFKLCGNITHLVTPSETISSSVNILSATVREVRKLRFKMQLITMI